MMTRPVTALLGVGLALGIAASAAAADLELPPESTRIRFELDSTLHRVSGVARLEEAVVSFDPAGGDASGRIVIDATSLESGNGLRDRQMHGKVLESERFPRIEFRPHSLVVVDRGDSQARIALVGVLHMHGGEWPLRIPAQVSVAGDGFRVEGSFAIPYVEWGMRDMSNFLLSVDPEVVVHFEALGRITPHLVATSDRAEALR
jgi:polyisoprenoid-binding protein YceI